MKAADSPIHDQLEEERRTHTGAFAKFALDEPVSIPEPESEPPPAKKATVAKPPQKKVDQ